MRRSERGAVLVEAAIVLPLLFALIIGMITGGMTLSRENSVENAAREGSRFAARAVVEPSMAAWLSSALDATVGAATGDLGPGAANQFVCVAYVHPAGSDPDDQTARMTETGGVRSALELNQTCFNDGRPPNERRVQVVARRTSEIQTVVYSTEVQLVGESVSVYERR